MFSRANRWGLSITTRAGLGVTRITDSHAPTFEFGPHFVVDAFIDCLGADAETQYLGNMIHYGVEYIESPTATQRAFDAAAKPIDNVGFVELLNREIGDLTPYVNGEKSYDFWGDPSVHLQSMRNAVAFLETNSRIPLFLVACLDA